MSGDDDGRAGGHAGGTVGGNALPVAVSREQLHDIEAPDAFETAGSFVLRVTNHGRDAHVHVKLGDDLARAASLGESNYYVERDGTVEIQVSVDPAATPASGRLTVETGYGAESADVGVTVDEPDRAGVRVDDRLAEPQRESGADGSTVLPVAVLAVVAVGVAAATAFFFDDPVVIGGTVVVLAGVVVAATLLLR